MQRRLLAPAVLLLVAVGWLLIQGVGGAGLAPRDRAGESGASPPMVPGQAEPALVGRADARADAEDGEEGTAAETDDFRVEVSGHVRASKNGPGIAGATVEILAHWRTSRMRHERILDRATTDDGGSFTMAAPRPPHAMLKLLGRAPGRRSMRREIYVGLSKVHRCEAWDLVLPPAGRAEGHVVCPDGGSPEGAKVSWQASPPWASRWEDQVVSSAPVSADGRFALDHLPLDVNLVLVAEREGAHGCSTPLRIASVAPRGRGIVIPLRARGEVHGRLVLADGAPWPRGTLLLRPSGIAAGGTGRRAGHVREDGTFSISGVPAGRYRLELDDADLGDTRTVAQEVVLPAGASVDLGEVVAARGQPISGRVVLEDGEPDDTPSLALVSGADLYVTEVEEDLGFLFPVVKPGTWRLIPWDRSWRAKRDIRVQPGTDGLVVELVGPSAAIEVVLSDAEGRTPDAWLCLTALPHGVPEPVAFFVQESHAGRVSLEAPRGTYDLRLETRDYDLWTRDGVTLARGETLRLEAQVVPAPRLRRRVVDPTGRPVAAAEVLLTQDRLYPLGPAYPYDHVDEERDGTRTRSDGTFEIRIPRPDLTLTVKAEGHAGLRVAVADLPEGDVVLPQGWDLMGRVLGSDDRGLGCVALQLDRGGRHTLDRRKTITTPDGSFRFPCVSAGTWTLYVLGQAGVVHGRVVEVAGGRTDVGAIRIHER